MGVDEVDWIAGWRRPRWIASDNYMRSARERAIMSSFCLRKTCRIGASPFPYIVLIIPHAFPEELIKGENFILVDLLKSIPGISSQAGSNQDSQVEFAQEALTIVVRSDQSPLVVQDSKHAPQVTKKKKWK